MIHNTGKRGIYLSDKFIHIKGNPVNLQDYLQQINNENLLTEKEELCKHIHNLYEINFKAITENVNKINSDNKLKYINAYIMVMFGYGKEIALLQQLKWNNSIESLSRDLLECYAYLKKLISLYYDTPKF